LPRYVPLTPTNCPLGSGQSPNLHSPRWALRPLDEEVASGVKGISDTESFKKLYLDPNITILEIARVFNVDRATVRREARRLQLPLIKRNFRRTASKPFTPEEWEQFKKRFESWTLEELAEHYRVAPRTISAWAAQKGFKKQEPNPEVIAEQPGNGSYEELLELVKRSARLIRRETWTPPEISVSLDVTEPIALVFTSDWHLGSPGVDYETFDEVRKLIIETEGVYAYIGGDGTERFMTALAPKGAGIDQQPITIQRLFFIRAIEGMLDKVIAFGTGNHEEWARFLVFDDYARRFGFYGVEVANPTVILFPYERKMIGFKRLQDAIIMLQALRQPSPK